MTVPFENATVVVHLPLQSITTRNPPKELYPIPNLNSDTVLVKVLCFFSHSQSFFVLFS